MKTVLPYLILFGQSCCVMASYQSCMNDYAKKEKELKEQGLKCEKESHKEHFEKQEDLLEERHKAEKDFLKKRKEQCLSKTNIESCLYLVNDKQEFSGIKK